ncbi:MAG: GNAT family N-acetyltransferase [Luteibaculaceae bacterium]
MEVRFIEPHETFLLRHKVLWPHLETVEECTMEGDTAEGNFHLGVLDMNDMVVAIGSFVQDIHPEFGDQNQYRLRAMASDPDKKGSGLGTLLLNEAFTILQDKGINILWCDARLAAVPFYEKLGFIKIGDIYQKPNVGPHYLMYREL